VCRAGLSVNGAIVRVCRASLSVCRALSILHRALLSVHGSHMTEISYECI